MEPADHVERLAETPKALAHLVVERDDEALDAAPDGEWSARVILAHLRDAEALEFRLGLERLLAEEEPTLYFMAAEVWEANRNRGHDRKEDLLAGFALQRQASLGLLRTLRHTDWRRAGLGPCGQRFTLAQLVEAWAGHDASHIAQMEAALGETVEQAIERRTPPPE